MKTSVVMPGLDLGIHSVTLALAATATEWIAGSSPAMTTTVAEDRRSLRGHASFPDKRALEE